MFGGRFRRWPVLGGGAIQPMRLGVEGDGARAALRGERRGNSERIGRHLADNGERAFAVRTEGKPECRIERSTIFALAYRDGGDVAPGVGIEHYHLAVAAVDE